MRLGGLVQRLSVCRRGISAVELALVLTLFLGLLFGVINLSLVLWTQASLYFAAQAAARCASANPTICGAPANGSLVEAYAMNQYFGQSVGGTNPFTYSASGCGHTVTANYSYPLSIPFYGDYPLSLSASACFPAGGSTG
jgi:Flp pilus assembly protein TadG